MSEVNAPEGADGWSAVHLGRQHSCGVAVGGRAWCWGFGGWGLLGLEDTNIVAVAPVAQGDERWTALGTGRTHTCGLRLDGTLWCWGARDAGQLGDGRRIPRLDPETDEVPYEWQRGQVGRDDDWTELVAGYFHACALRADRTAWCWGFGTSGALGNDDNESSSTPVAVTGGAAWRSLTAGAAHTCGIRDDGTLACWGLNSAGQLGDGTQEDQWAPAQVGDDADWESVTAGWLHTCGIRSDRSLWCWGSDGFGQLGAQAGEQHEPVAVAPDVRWATIVAGGWHTCGITAEGALWCSGSNDYGQIGDTSSLDSGTFGPLTEESGTAEASRWVALDLGEDHTCAIDDGGRLWCLGQNTLSQAGAPSIHDRPVRVYGP